MGLAGDGHDCGVVEESVETRGGQKRVAEVLGEFVDGAVEGDEVAVALPTEGLGLRRRLSLGILDLGG